MKFNKWMAAAFSITLLAACNKKNDPGATAGEMPGEKVAVPLPKGFKVLTASDLRQELQQKGMLPGEINATLASTKLTIRPEEFGQTAAEINRKLKTPTPKANTENGAPNIMEAALVQNNLIDARFNLDPAVNTPNQWTGQPQNYQGMRYDGNHWYWNQAPGGGTYGYFSHRGGSFYYYKNHNSDPSLYNCQMSTSASFIWRSNNTACYHMYVLYYWNGSSWIAIASQTNFRNAADMWQTTSDITAYWRLGGEYFLLGYGFQSNGWNPPGWPVWRTQHVQFRLYW